MSSPLVEWREDYTRRTGGQTGENVRSSHIAILKRLVEQRLAKRNCARADDSGMFIAQIEERNKEP